MNIDFNQVRDDYRKSYNLFKKTKGQTPISPIDFCETYILKTTTEDNELFNKFSHGLTPDEFKPYYKFVSDNLPSDNLKVIIVDRTDNYRMVTFSICDNGSGMAVRHEGSDSTEKRQMVSSYMAMASMYNTLKDISDNKVYVCRKNADYVAKRNGRLMPNNVVFFSREKRHVVISGESFNKIDWKHSWSVVGHWRKIKKLGKNRVGEYCEVGRTWVNPSIKGSGTFISKPRVCIGE